MKQNLSIFILMFTLPAFALCQPVIQKQKVIGGTGPDILLGMCLTNDGGIIAGGKSWSNKSYEKTQDARGGADYWIIKVDRAGKIEWDKTIGGNGDDNFKSIIQTSDGGYAIIGESISSTSAEKSEDSRGGPDYWLVKLDKSGNIQWDKTIGGNGNDVIDNIVQTNDGDYILVGSSDSNMSGEKTENSRGNFDMWVVKVNKNGKKIWDKTIGGSDYDLCSPFQVTTDGGIILAGFSGSNQSGEKSESNRGAGSDIWVVKLNKKGLIEWDKTIGGSDDDYCHSIYQTPDGGYAIGGSSLSGISGEKSEQNKGGYDYWLIKVDKHGNKIWDRTIGSNDNDYFNSMIRTKAGGSVMTGGSVGNASADKTENSRGGADYWIVNVNGSGRLLWEKTIGGYYDDWAYGAAEPVRNKFVIAGFSYSPDGADKTLFSRGDADYWLVQLNGAIQVTHMDESADAANNTVQNFTTKRNLFTVYPNPAKDILHVQNDGKAIVSLTDQLGKVLVVTNINGKSEINIASLAAGLYYLKNNTTGHVQKVIIAR